MKKLFNNYLNLAKKFPISSQNAIVMILNMATNFFYCLGFSNIFFIKIKDKNIFITPNKKIYPSG